MNFRMGFFTFKLLTDQTKGKTVQIKSLNINSCICDTLKTDE